MNLDLRYLGRSEARAMAWGTALRLSPNLSRARVSFDAELVHPLRFREAISALHEVVVGDLRFKPKDKSGYAAFKRQRAMEEQRLRNAVAEKVHREEFARQAAEPPAPELGPRFQVMHSLYWAAWQAWTHEVWLTELVRHVLAFDPVVTVAPDCVFFEAFARDESSYGALYVDRGALRNETGTGEGTTNVDYSAALFEHFQQLRTYRSTRLQVDPSGFEVKTEGHPDLREEKIDLPPSWLRGFGQLQAAMGLPSRRVDLPPGAVYSVLAFLRRHREKTGPRSLLFKLVPGQVPLLVLEPWGTTITCHGARPWDGPAEEIKVWGRRRLLALARVLPLAERIEVRLLGSGLPSVWIAHLGEMRFVLALSGWTANDWTSGAALEGLGAHRVAPAETTEAVRRHLEESRSASLAQLFHAVPADEGQLLGALHQLAKQGQVLYDHAAQRYRFRQVMPVALSEAVLGPEPVEVVAGKGIFLSDGVRILRREPVPESTKRRFFAESAGIACEGLVDVDGGLSGGKCGCSHFFRFRLRKGPCRHLLALKLTVQAETARSSR